MGKRILFVTQRKLLPMHDGALIFSVGFLKFLRQMDAIVDCVSFHDKDVYSDTEKRILNDYCNLVTSVKIVWKNTALNFSLKYPNSIRKYTRKSMKNTISDMCKTNSYDIIIIDHLQMAEYIKDVNGYITVLNEHNVETEIWENYYHKCRWFMKPFVKINARKMRKYESQVLERFHYVLAISERDRDNLYAMNPNANIRVMHPFIHFNIVKSEDSLKNVSKKIMFVGSFDWYPNQKAAMYLMDEVMPVLRTKIDGIKLYLVGKDPSSEMLNYAKGTDDIIVTGRVESTDEYYRDCDLFVNPIDNGSGINIKMLEAMAKGVPIVSSRFGFRGFTDTEDGIASVYESVEECVNVIVALLNDEKKRRNQRKAALEAYFKFIEPNEETRSIFQ